MIKNNGRGYKHIWPHVSQTTLFYNKEGLVDCKLVQLPPALPSNFIAIRTKAAFRFSFFIGIRCGVLLLMVILVINIKKVKIIV